jgi:dTDP-4-dehydrorhamnose reductase
MKWLITGANGQLGKSLQKTLQAHDIDFVALPRTSLDITNIELVKRSIESIKPMVVINAAAYTNVEQAEMEPHEAFKVNQIGATNIAVACKSARVRLVHFSTDYVFSGKEITPRQVNDPKEPSSVYGKSKLAGENGILKEYSENSVIIRTAWLYSVFGRNFYKTILRKALTSNETVRVVSDQQGQPTSALDLAELTINAVTKSITTGVFHGTNGGSCSWFEYAKYIFELVGEDSHRVTPVLSSEFTTKAHRPKYSALENEKWSEFGIKPLGPWRESVRNALPAMVESLDM